MLTLDKIYRASHTLKGVIRETDLIYAPNIGNECEFYLKTENLQITGSFKVRGSYFKMSSLTETEKEKGVIACSAGNHAQGVALAAKKNNIESTIFIPSIAPISKIEATKEMGAKIEIVNGVYDDAYSAAIKFQKETGKTFIHPFDDIDVIAGQGTIGLELLNSLPEMEAVVVPVGGGGLISGVATAIKKLNPSCKVYGVQAGRAASMYNSYKKNQRLEIPKVLTFADGIAVKSPGELTFDLCKKYVDDIVIVSEDEIATAILKLMEKQKLVAEGAGATAVAAVMFNKLPLKGKKTVAIVSGGNIDVNILSRVINRGLLTSGRLSELAIEMLDRPGELKEVSAIIASKGANVIKVTHNPQGENTDINSCYLYLTMETRNFENLKEIKTALKEAGYIISDNK